MCTVVILTGLPATGKSTLARRLSSRLGWPLFSKDDIKESMADSLGTGDRQLSKAYGRASIAIQFRLLRRCLESGTSAIAETFFHGPLAAGACRNLQGATNCRLIQIVLHCNSDAWLERFTKRTKSGDRHPIHHDPLALQEVKEMLARGDYHGVDIECPTLTVDSSDPSTIDIDTLCRFIKANS